jgi:Thioesterase-like superfamily
MESALALLPSPWYDLDVWINAHPIWQRPGARGLYGGALVAQCLIAAQKTVPTQFVPHSIYCSFLRAASAGSPVSYHVKRTRDGANYISRHVEAQQNDRVVLSALLSFAQASKRSQPDLIHGQSFPTDLRRQTRLDDVHARNSSQDDPGQPFSIITCKSSPASAPDEETCTQGSHVIYFHAPRNTRADKWLSVVQCGESTCDAANME